ncbi:unnamed protein product [Musa textilis]
MASSIRRTTAHSRSTGGRHDGSSSPPACFQAACQICNLVKIDVSRFALVDAACWYTVSIDGVLRPMIPVSMQR